MSSHRMLTSANDQYIAVIRHGGVVVGGAKKRKTHIGLRVRLISQFGYRRCSVLNTPKHSRLNGTLTEPASPLKTRSKLSFATRK